MNPALATRAHDGEPHASKNASREQAAQPLSVQIKNDRLTLAFTTVPQIYLVGVIDAGAPERFSALVKSGKIPTGSDVYLNSPGGDLHAAMALGRLFRAGSLVTHLGTPRRTLRSGPGLNTSVCTDACIYAYLGGLYRWAPTGSDRIGLSSVQAIAAPSAPGSSAPDDVVSYLKEMGIDPAVLPAVAKTSSNAVAWLTADQMMATGLANNGRLPLTVKYELSSAAPYLVLSQVDRQGEHRIMVQCKPGSVTLTAYDLVGAQGAREIVAGGTRSYFEINRQEILTQQRDGASVSNESVTITRAYPPTQLGRLISAQSIGAWVGGRTNAFRYGFVFQLAPVKGILMDYYNACWRAAPWPVKQD